VGLVYDHRKLPGVTTARPGVAGVLQMDKNGDRMGPFRGISGTLRREGRGECCGDSEVFYVVAPICVG
jgi:hypothetical protein